MRGEERKRGERNREGRGGEREKGNEASILNYDFILFRCIFIYIFYSRTGKKVTVRN